MLKSTLLGKWMGLVMGLLLMGASVHATGTEDAARQRWLAVIADGYAAPALATLAADLDALVSMSASPDPALRDDIGYAIFARWIHRDARIDASTMAKYHDRLLAQAQQGLGDALGEKVYARSFAMLFLKELVFASQRTGYMDKARMTATVNAAVDALDREKDLRGWTPENGWAHALAHAADLVRALGRHPSLAPEDRERLINAISRRLRRPTEPFVWGEEVRIATALTSLFAGDAKSDGPLAWFSRVGADCGDVWKGAFDVARYRVAQREGAIVGAMIAHDGARGVGLPPAALAAARKAITQCQ